MFNAIKIWKKWKAFPPRSIYCSTAQSQPHNQNCYSHRSKCSCSSKIFLWLHQLPYLLQQLSGSLCNIQSQARSQTKRQDYVKRHKLPEISPLYSEDGLMQCLTQHLSKPTLLVEQNQCNSYFGILVIHALELDLPREKNESSWGVANNMRLSLSHLLHCY